MNLMLKGALAASAFFYATQDTLTPAYAQSSEDAAARACASDKPFVVFDVFHLKTPVQGKQPYPGPREDWLDVDGDLQYKNGQFEGFDALHGDVVAAIAGANGRPVIPFQVREFSPSGIIQAMAELADFLERMEPSERPAGIIASLSLPVPLFQINYEAGEGAVPITPDNMDEPENRARVEQFLARQFPAFMNPYLQVPVHMKRIENLGIPVFVAAGNYGPVHAVNYLSMLGGVHTVGALDRAGNKAEFTNQSVYTRLQRKGSLTFRKVPGGIDMNGDDKPEFTDDQLSSGPSIARQYAGKPVSGTVKAVPDFIWQKLAVLRQRSVYEGNSFNTELLAEELPEGIYSTEDIMTLFGQEMLGQTVFNVRQGKWMHHPSRIILQETPEGLLALDPEGTSDPAQRRSWDATSAAAPNICTP